MTDARRRPRLALALAAVAVGLALPLSAQSPPLDDLALMEVTAEFAVSEGRPDAAVRWDNNASGASGAATPSAPTSAATGAPCRACDDPCRDVTVSRQGPGQVGDWTARYCRVDGTWRRQSALTLVRAAAAPAPADELFAVEVQSPDPAPAPAREQAGAADPLGDGWATLNGRLRALGYAATGDGRGPTAASWDALLEFSRDARIAKPRRLASRQLQPGEADRLGASLARAVEDTEQARTRGRRDCQAGSVAEARACARVG